MKPSISHDLTIVIWLSIPVLAEGSVVFAGLVRALFARFARLTAISNLGIALGYSASGAVKASSRTPMCSTGLLAIGSNREKSRAADR
jgi:hypothetical protein